VIVDETEDRFQMFMFKCLISNGESWHCQGHDPWTEDTQASLWMHLKNSCKYSLHSFFC